VSVQTFMSWHTSTILRRQLGSEWAPTNPRRVRQGLICQRWFTTLLFATSFSIAGNAQDNTSNWRRL
jgi:hypothetical protein